MIVPVTPGQAGAAWFTDHWPGPQGSLAWFTGCLVRWGATGSRGAAGWPRLLQRPASGSLEIRLAVIRD